MFVLKVVIMRFMKKYLVRNFFSLIVLVATFMGATHHHNDLQTHSDCQICTISTSVTDIDTPSEVVYLTPLTLQHEATLSQLVSFTSKHIGSQNNPRAPPATILNS